MIVNSLTKNNTSVNETNVFYFSSGLFGFEAEKKFFIVKHSKSDLFIFLQSTENSEISFILTQGSFFFPKLLEDDCKKLKKNENIFHIITISGKEEIKFSLNLLGPIIINIEKNEGRQIVSEKKKMKLNILLQKKK